MMAQAFAVVTKVALVITIFLGVDSQVAAEAPPAHAPHELLSGVHGIHVHDNQVHGWSIR